MINSSPVSIICFILKFMIIVLRMYIIILSTMLCMCMSVCVCLVYLSIYLYIIRVCTVVHCTKYTSQY